MKSRFGTLLIGFAGILTALLAGVPAVAQAGMGGPKVTPSAPTKTTPGSAPRTRKLQRRHSSSVNTNDQAEDNSSASNSTTTDSKPAVDPLYNPGTEDKKQGIDAFNKQQYDQAIERLNVAANIRKADAEVFYYLGDAYQEKDNYPKAIEAYEHAISINPAGGTADNFFRQGYSYEMLPANNQTEVVKNNTSALAAYKNADQRKPNSAETLTRLGDVSSKLGQWRNAVAYYQRALDLDQNIKDPDVFFNWGIAYVNSSLDYESALPRFKRAIELNIDNVAEAYYQFGRACKETNRTQEAVDAYRKQLEKKNDDLMAWDAYRMLSFIYSAQGDWQAQAEACRNAVKIKGDDDFLWNNLGTAEGNLGHTDASLEAYRRAVTLAPDKTNYQLDLARTYFKMKRYNEAVDVLNKTVSLDQNHAFAFYYRGMSYSSLNQFDHAIQSLNRAIEIGLQKKIEGSARYYLVVSYSGLGNTSAARQQCDLLKAMGPDAPPQSVGTCAN